MAQIDFRKKINWHRRYRSPQGVKTEHEILRIFESDRGRIINSPAIRRLQQKTQVFPLERNAAVRTRLTHSMEVQQVGRYIAKEILSRLKELKLLEAYGLDELTGPFESIVEMSCLMHDIGNPPFGHFGEAAINDWFRQRLHPEDAESQPLTDDRCSVAALRLRDGEEPLNELRRKIRQDLCHFEGNAQGIRLVHTLMRMNLTWAQVGGILKYTRPAWWRGETPETHHYLMKKPGYYLSEEAYIARLRKELNLALYSRFPLTWIMEAADDICYQIMDIEDACKLHILTTEEAIQLLLNFFEGERLEHIIRVMKMVDDTNEQIAYLRSCIIGLLVDECSRIFLENEEGILDGTYNTPLIEKIGEQPKLAYAACSQTAYKKIYRAKEVLDIELAGYHIFSHLIDSLTEAVMNQSHAYSKLLLQRIPEQYDTNAPTTYGKIQCVLDYISGMTDVYALDLYRKITGMSLPAV